MCDLESGSVKVKEPSNRGRWHGCWYERLVQPCLVELLGSALFIFIGCLSVIENGPDTGRLQPALAHGLALGLVIATLGNIRWEQLWALSLVPAAGSWGQGVAWWAGIRGHTPRIPRTVWIRMWAGGSDCLG